MGIRNNSVEKTENGDLESKQFSLLSTSKVNIYNFLVSKHNLIWIFVLCFGFVPTSNVEGLLLALH